MVLRTFGPYEVVEPGGGLPLPALVLMDQRCLPGVVRRPRRLAEAIAELETTRGGGGMNIVFKAARELRPWRQEPLVAEVHDRLLGLMTAA
ncbi:hypothetical protein [Streptomyces hirsutus]|uniref:hypothetical protein n=1 Tax=Streptomyces hirsutus TaxID=35620 RepID=UPI00332F7A41